MTLRTPLCERLGIKYPVIQAPIGSSSTVALVAAVSEAGGLGVLSGTWREPEELREMVREIRRLTGRPFGVNLILAWPMEERFRICLEEGVPLLSLFWGDVGSFVGRGVPILHSVGSVAEAVESRAEIVVAQGWEAGGHVRGTVSTMVLTPAVADAVRPRPVIAAGGIADGRGVAAALALGAQAAWIGTRFLFAEEARVHPLVRERVRAAGTDDTVYTEMFNGEWPAAPHRVLRNRLTELGQELPRNVIGTSPTGAEVRRYDMMMPLPETTGVLDEMPMYAGQSVGLAHQVQPAAEIVAELVREAAAILES